MVTKVLSIYPTKQSLLIVQDLWQVHNLVLLIISQKKFIKLNVKIAILSVKDNLIKNKCLFSNKNYSNRLYEKLKNKFKNTFKFSNNNNKFIWLLRKDTFFIMSQNYLKK